MFTVSLSDLADHLEEISDDWSGFYNVKTGEVVIIPDDGFGGDDEMFQEDSERVEGADFIPLPSQYEIHEYRIMESFAEEKGSKSMLRALRGRGAFRRFKDRCSEEGLSDAYFAFRHQALIDIARRFCEENNIPYKD